MLESLKVRNIALIEDASIEVPEGLVVLSGETGAGKTALLFSLRLLEGQRSDSGMVRDGASTGSVEGVFSQHGKRMTVRRQVAADGRSTCWIDGRRCAVSDLAQVVGPLVDLHGQHEHQALLDPSTHVRYLDAWIGSPAADALAAYRSAYASHAAAKLEYERIERTAGASQRDLELASFAIHEIDAVAPVEGEREQLEESLPALQHADSLAGAASQALEALRAESGAEDGLQQAYSSLAHEAGVDKRLDALADRLSGILADEQDLAAELREYRDSLDFDPRVLSDALDRLSALDGLCKRFGPRIEDVFARRREAAEAIALSDTSDEALASARQSLDDASSALEQAAGSLSKLREDHAGGFIDSLTQAVSGLAMQGASFSLAMSQLPRSAWGQDGPQHVELLYSPGTGVAPRPLARIASGGELSRVMLALVGEVDLAAADTLVFDEVDAGIGGATANLVGKRLASLGKTHQVIVVTHLPQIAVLAGCQMSVEKAPGAGGAPVTRVRVLSGEARAAEIARMLSGSAEGVSLEHARAMLEEAQQAAKRQR